MAGATPDYALFADALDYPGAGWAAVLARMDLAADPSGSVAAFAAAARELPLGALQEIYTATFDMQPDMTLSTGFHLFGDDYQRSDFLVRLSGILRARQFAYGAELPDHACLLLRFLAQAAGGPEAEGLAEECLAPALARVAARLETQNAPACSPYRHLLRAITAALPPPTLDLGASANLLPVLR